MLKKRLLQAYITLTLFFIAWQGVKYVAKNIPELNSAVTITIVIIAVVIVGAVAGQAITRMIDDYDKRNDQVIQETKSKPGKK